MDAPPEVERINKQTNKMFQISPPPGHLCALEAVGQPPWSIKKRSLVASDLQALVPRAPNRLLAL